MQDKRRLGSCKEHSRPDVRQAMIPFMTDSSPLKMSKGGRGVKKKRSKNNAVAVDCSAAGEEKLLRFLMCDAAIDQLIDNEPLVKFHEAARGVERE